MTTRSGRVATAALAMIPLAVVAVFFAYPVAGMLARGFAPDGVLDLGSVAEVLGRPRVHRVLWFTVWTAAIATAISVLGGVPVAFALYRLALPGRRVLGALVVLPFVLPTVVVGVAFRRLIATGGPLGSLGLDGTPVAIIAALVFFNLGVVVRTVGALWEGVDARAEEAAAALGARPWQVFRTVTLPTLAPAIVSAASVVFLFCATAFGVVLTLGGLRYANVETEIYLLTTQELDLTSAAALSVLQIAMITFLLALSHRARRSAAPRAGGAGSAAPRALRAADAPLICWLLVVTVFMVTPMAALATASLRGPGGWTLDNYRALQTTGSDQALLATATAGLAQSLLVAAQAAAMALTLGAIVAYLISRPTRTRAAGRWRAAFDGLFMLPLGVSAVTLGFGFLITLDSPPLDLRSSPFLVPIAQAMVALPLVVRVVAPALGAIDPRQREAAASLGAGGARVLATVDLAQAWRPLLAAAGFAFAVSLGEFGATSFLARADQPTLPVVIYQLISRPGADHVGMATAASVILAGATAAVMLGVERIGGTRVGGF